jgi:hypothetical protein
MNRPLALDHLGLLTHDLAAAARAMERLGFTLAPPSFHRERRAGRTVPEKTGTANQCLMFRRGYVEVLGIVDRRRYSGWITDALRRYHGLHVVGFEHEDMEALLASLAAQGRSPLVRKLTRIVEVAGEERSASFTILFHSEAEFPEGRFVTMQHHTREVLWHPSLLDHPNGALALAGVTLAVDDPAEFAGRVAAWTGAGPVQAEGQRLRLDHPGGFVEAMTARTAREIYGSALPLLLPRIIGMTVAVADLADTARCLERRQVDYRSMGGGLLVSAADCCGSFLYFVHEA